jgi:hypothetical protein
METIETPTTSPSNAVIFGVGALCGAVVGTAAGYFVARRKYFVKTIDEISWYEPAVAEEEDEVGIDVVEDDEDDAPVGRGLYIVDSIPGEPVNYNVPVEPVIDDTPAPTVTDIFANSGDDWDFDKELQNRRTNMPYVIHVDEYMENEDGRRQHTVTYYEGDDVMVDELEVVIYNHAGLMGELKFGHGSKDHNVVYIRNEAERMEWEVLRHTGHYSIEVLGLEAEEEPKTGPRRFRED